MKQLIHAIDWLAAAILAMASTAYIPGAMKMYNVVDNIWLYSVLVMAAVAWAIGRVLFKRLSKYA